MLAAAAPGMQVGLGLGRGGGGCGTVALCVRQDGVLDWAEFRQVMTDVYRELGEPPAEPDKLLAMFERNQVDGKVHFDQYLEGARQGLQKRMVLYET